MTAHHHHYPPTTAAAHATMRLTATTCGSTPVSHDAQLRQLSDQLQHMLNSHHSTPTTTTDTHPSPPHTPPPHSDTHTLAYMHAVKQYATDTLQHTVKLLKVGSLFYTYVQSAHTAKLIKKTLLIKYSSIYRNGCIQMYGVTKGDRLDPTGHHHHSTTDAIHTITLASITNIYIGRTTCTQMFGTSALYSQHSPDALCWAVEYEVQAAYGDTRPSRTNTCVLALEALDGAEMSCWVVTLLALMANNGKQLDIVHADSAVQQVGTSYDDDGDDDDAVENKQLQNMKQMSMPRPTNSHVVNALQSTLQPSALKPHTDTSAAIAEWLATKNAELERLKHEQHVKQAEVDRLKHAEQIAKQQAAQAEYTKWLKHADSKLEHQQSVRVRLAQTALLAQQAKKAERQQQGLQAAQKLEQRLHREHQRTTRRTQRLQRSQSAAVLAKRERSVTAVRDWMEAKRDEMDVLVAKVYAAKLLDGIEADNARRLEAQAENEHRIANMPLTVSGKQVKHILVDEQQQEVIPDDLNTTVDNILKTSSVKPSVLLDVTKLLQHEREQLRRLEQGWADVYVPPPATQTVKAVSKTPNQNKKSVKPAWGAGQQRPRTANLRMHNVVQQTV